MPHELTGALQQASGIRQGCTVKEPYVDVRLEYIDIAERSIAQTCNRATVVHEFPNFVATLSHHLKPTIRDGSQFPSMLVHPGIDGGIPRDSAVESQQFRSPCRSAFCSRHLSLCNTGYVACVDEKRRRCDGRVAIT